jgi:glycerate-2-kinase
VKGNGRGGRNAEFLLALTEQLDGHPGIYAMACDTDGIDGTEDNAGAFYGPDTLERADKAGISTKRASIVNMASSVWFHPPSRSWLPAQKRPINT